MLTREVFGLELTRSGFHRLLFEAAEGERDLDAVTEKFDNEVGSDGRALINSIIASRDNGARG